MSAVDVYLDCDSVPLSEGLLEYFSLSLCHSVLFVSVVQTLVLLLMYQAHSQVQ